MLGPRVTSALLIGTTGLLLACGQVEPTVEAPPPSPANSGQTIPITTRSDDAYDLYLEGRRLAESLRPTEARQFYLQALEQDRHFALAHLALANSSVTAREFFVSMERALAVADVVSEGERLMILAQDAGVRGAPDEQLEHLNRLVALYPDDPRAHTMLAAYHFGRQEFLQSAGHYEMAVELDPEFASAYNNMGYLYRNLGRYDEAEKAFLRYIELIPDEPNPYDSYAELLMKVGRFEESIAAYEKALAIKPDFLFSYRGIGHDLVFLDRHQEAREVFARQFELAPDVGQQRNALFWQALSWVDEGEFDRALEVVGELYRLAESGQDLAAMAGDLMTMGGFHLQAGDPDAAEERFVEALQLIGEAEIPEEVKENNRRNFLYWKARIELARGRLDDAERHLTSYQEQVAKRQIPFEERRVHELAGSVAAARGDAAAAIDEYSAAGDQNPRILYLLAQAHLASGDRQSAEEIARKAAEFNAIGTNYAYVRRAARALLDEITGD